MIQIKRNRCPTKQALVPQPGASPASLQQAVLSQPWDRAVPRPPAPGLEALSRRAAPASSPGSFSEPTALQSHLGGSAGTALPGRQRGRSQWTAEPAKHYGKFPARETHLAARALVQDRRTHHLQGAPRGKLSRRWL